VFGIAVRILRDPDSAEDICQRVFERAWTHAATFDSRRGSVSVWLTTITRNIAIDELRKGRVVTLAPEHLDRRTDPRHVGKGPDDEAVLDDWLRWVLAGLSCLPETQRRAVLLSAWHGRTAAEVAELESIPLGTAKTRIRVGLQRLRAALVVADSVVADSAALPATGPAQRAQQRQRHQGEQRPPNQVGRPQQRRAGERPGGYQRPDGTGEHQPVVEHQADHRPDHGPEHADRPGHPVSPSR
jgi:RNA polymerase sigma factor (sigma-70 family)